MPLALAAALLAATTSTALPPSRPVLLVVVHQETRELLDATAIREIDRDVRQVWSRYADVSLRTAHDDLAVADDVLTLVITDRQSEAGAGLGWIQFDGDRPSHAIYVSRTEVVRLGEQGRWVGRSMAEWAPKAREIFLRRAMALAIAHEVGHYLLRSKAHTASGLMRARFTVDELMRGSPAKYRLGSGEQAILRQRMRGYLLARNGAVDAAMP